MEPGCFCYLVNHTQQGVDDFIKSLRLLKANYLKRYPTPVIAFHEAQLTCQARIVEESGVQPVFVPIEFKLPDCVDKSRICGERLGYMHMCHFFANDIFSHPALADFEYYCRLDTDSFIMSPVYVNLFDWARANDCKYGFIDDAITDNPSFFPGLWATGGEFARANPQYPTYARLYTEIPEGRVYYTNFELCNMAWFRSEPWTRYFDAIDKAGGIYYHRWGDHTIRYMGVRLFMPPVNIRRVTFIHYRHTFEYNRSTI